MTLSIIDLIIRGRRRAAIAELWAEDGASPCTPSNE
jgi:hypothetical protein